MQDPTPDLPTRSPARVPAAGMRLRFAALWSWLLDWLFRPVRFPEEEARTLHELAERGTVVYVSRNAGLLPFLYFNWAFIRLQLPLAHYVNGVRRHLAGLFGRGLSPTVPSGAADDGSDEARLAATVDAGRPALVFLWRRAKALTGRRNTFPSDHAAALVRLQRRTERPIYLVPTLLLFGQRPTRSGGGPSLFDVLFGPREAPGHLRSLLTFLRFRRRAWVKLGEPIDLKTLVEAHASADDALIGRKVRGALAQYLAREERVVTGPPLKSPERLQREVLRDMRLRDTLAEIAHDTGRRLPEVVKEARRDLKEIAARYTPAALTVYDKILRVVFNRIYDGIEVDQEGLSAIARAARKGPVILCPTHRSHMDYLVLSWVFYQHGLNPPHVAAGKNLSFWPLGPLFRRGGAYFLRRSFREDRVYSAVFRAYVRKLLREGVSQEFFIEGTRSRTGKMLPPRLGMVAYEVEAFLESSRSDVSFVPVSIGYTRVIESGSYRSELMGREKKSEDVRGLFKAGEVLRSRWGRIYIQVGEPLSLAGFMRDRGLDPEASGEADGTGEARRRLVQALAHQVTWSIDRLTTVMPTSLAAAAMLSDRRRGLELQEILARSDFFAGRVRLLPWARFAPTVRFTPEGALERAPIQEAVQSLADEGYVKIHRLGRRTVVEIVPEGRLGLDYYKNALAPFFMEPSLVAHALLSYGRPGVRPAPLPRVAVRERVRLLSALLRREFAYRPDVPLETTFDEVISGMVRDGWVRPSGEGAGLVEVTPEGERALGLLRMLTLNLVEGYWVTLRAVAQALAEGPATEKELVARVLDEGRVLVLTGEIAAAEALSKPVVQAALGALIEYGKVGRVGKRGSALAPTDLSALERMEAELAPFVGGAPAA